MRSRFIGRPLWQRVSKGLTKTRRTRRVAATRPPLDALRFPARIRARLTPRRPRRRNARLKHSGHTNLAALVPRRRAFAIASSPVAKRERATSRSAFEKPDEVAAYMALCPDVDSRAARRRRVSRDVRLAAPGSDLGPAGPRARLVARRRPGPAASRLAEPPTPESRSRTSPGGAETAAFLVAARCLGPLMTVR
jgi:hypothetical protein